MFELRGVFCEGNENGLGHVFSKMRIANHAEGSGVNEVKMARDKFCEGGLRMAFDVSLE